MKKDWAKYKRAFNLRRKNLTFEAIGNKLGVSTSRAQQLARGWWHVQYYPTERNHFKIMKTLLLAGFLLMAAESVWAACTTQTFYDTRTGRMTVCTTCYDAYGNPVGPTVCS